MLISKREQTFDMLVRISYAPGDIIGFAQTYLLLARDLNAFALDIAFAFPDVRVSFCTCAMLLENKYRDSFPHLRMHSSQVFMFYSLRSVFVSVWMLR